MLGFIGASRRFDPFSPEHPSFYPYNMKPHEKSDKDTLAEDANNYLEALASSERLALTLPQKKSQAGTYMLPDSFSPARDMPEILLQSPKITRKEFQQIKTYFGGSNSNYYKG